jgi:hypothetical protein
VILSSSVALVMAARPSLAWRQNVMLAASLIFVRSLTSHPLAFLPLIGFWAIRYFPLFASLRALSIEGQTPLSISDHRLLFVLVEAVKPHRPKRGLASVAYLTVGLSYILFGCSTSSSRVETCGQSSRLARGLTALLDRMEHVRGRSDHVIREIRRAARAMEQMASRSRTWARAFQRNRHRPVQGERSSRCYSRRFRADALTTFPRLCAP